MPQADVQTSGQREEEAGAVCLVCGSFNRAGHAWHSVKVMPFNLLISALALRSFAICSDAM